MSKKYELCLSSPSAVVEEDCHSVVAQLVLEKLAGLGNCPCDSTGSYFKDDVFLFSHLFLNLCLFFAACKCNSHANVCHVNTGKCFCTTKGIKGDQCQL